MSILPAHTAKDSFRQIIAAFMTVLYLTISLSPLASLAMHSSAVAHAITGECSGDCTICGCSAESRATRSCCCIKKKQQQARVHEDERSGTPDCCKKIPAKKKIVIASCGCPCESGKTIALSGGKAGEILPYYFTEQFVISHADTHYSDLSHLLTSRHAEPPEPPPRQA
jgi:hypothetical protein